MDSNILPSTIYSPVKNYGTSLDVLLLDIERRREHLSGCVSDDGIASCNKEAVCIECPYNPFKDSNDPCRDYFNLYGLSLIDNQKFCLAIPHEASINVEAIYRVLMALGGLSSRTVKISIKNFTDVNFYINKVIPH